MILLRVLSKLPNEYKKDFRRISLFRAIFKNCHYFFSVKNSIKIIDGFKHTFDQLEETKLPNAYEIISNRAPSDVAILALLTTFKNDDEKLNKDIFRYKMIRKKL